MEFINGQDRLDRTLFSFDLNNRDIVAERVISQLKNPSESSSSEEDLINSMWSFLEDIRSVTKEKTSHLKIDNSLNNDHSSDNTNDYNWKLKEKSDNHRVMYRKNFEDSKFHTICIEGVIDGPLNTALCVAWEATHFKEWWPQFSMPPFKILESFFIKKVKLGLDFICVRFKVPWPFASREILFQLFSFHFLEEDMIIVTMMNISEPTIQNFDTVVQNKLKKNNFVRMIVNGGFVFQKISKNKTFFRTLSNVDMKIDFVPAWVINFISRELAGSGYKLFQNTVKSIDINKKNGIGKIYNEILLSDNFYIHINEEEEKANITKGKKKEMREKEREREEEEGLEEKEGEIMETISEEGRMDELEGMDEEERKNKKKGREKEEEKEKGKEIMNEYGDLKERDSEIFDAILVLDKSIRFFHVQKWKRKK